MTNTKMEWVVRRLSITGTWMDCSYNHPQKEAAVGDLEALKRHYDSKFRLIERTTTTTTKERVIE